MAIAFVNTSTGQNSGGNTSLASAASVLTSGNVNIVVLRIGNVDIEDCGVTDTAGNLYHPLHQKRTGDGATLMVFYALNVTGHATNVVTATFPSSPYNVIVTSQFSGLATQSVVDVVVSQNGNGGSVVSPAYTTTVANELILMAAQVSGTGGTWTPAAGFSVALDSSDGVVAVHYQIVAGVQSAQTVTADPSDGSDNTVIVATFNETVTAGGASAYAFA
jgi:hypothetical protein